MIRLKELKEWIRPQIPPGIPIYSGAIDNTKECVLGLYNRSGAPINMAIGGKDNTSYETHRISLLVHWNKNYDTSEVQAGQIYDLFSGVSSNINGRNCFFKMLSPSPIGVGKSDSGVFEFVIDFDIIINKGEM